MEQIYTLGIDVGSTTSKGIILKNGKEIIARSLVPSGTGTTGPKRVLQELREIAGLSSEDIHCSLATGYGRQSEGLADFEMSELSCHAMGANFLFPHARTVIDIGGQDIKAIRVEDGMLRSFQMNDKCAAGTGRFLEVMANVLELKVEQMSDLAQHSTKPVQISSTCTVFAESEVISQLSKGEAICDIIAGIHRSVINKVTGLVHRLGLEEPVVMTGGVSRNNDIVRLLEEALQCRVSTSGLAPFAGAIGAAIFGFRKIQ